jgi:hypothetical protein
MDTTDTSRHERRPEKPDPSGRHPGDEPDRDRDRDTDDVPTVPPTDPQPAPVKEPPAPEQPSGYTVTS